MCLVKDPKKLKEKAKKLYEATVRDQLMTKTTISEIEEENKKQRDYLERTVQSLKRKLAKDMEMHRIDNRKVSAFRIYDCGMKISRSTGTLPVHQVQALVVRFLFR